MRIDELMESRELKIAVAAVADAAELARGVQAAGGMKPLTKTDLSPVTVADFAVQALVAGRLKHHFPADPIVAEEDSSALRDAGGSHKLSAVTHLLQRFETGLTEKQVCEWIDYGTGTPGERFWTLDPIDGTKGFLRGHQYAVALALIVNGGLELSVIASPRLRVAPGSAVPVDSAEEERGGSVTLAVRGRGTWTASLSDLQHLMRLSVSCRPDATSAVLVRSWEDEHTDLALLRQVQHSLGMQSGPIRMDSQAKYVMLAAGAADLLIRPMRRIRRPSSIKIWDHAAGVLLVSEAGGKVTDLDGRPIDFTAGRTLSNNRGVLASSGGLHRRALEAVAAATMSSTSVPD